MENNVAPFLRLMLVTDDALMAGREVVGLALAAERGGATSLQLRLKVSSPRRQVELARALVSALRIPVLVNDRPDVAIVADAWGAHLGPDDLPVRLARRIAPAPFVIGASVGSVAEALLARDADYWGVGPWRQSSTKSGAGMALGEAGFSRIVSEAAGKPCIAIGGIAPSDAAAALAAGAVGVAVVSGILKADDAELATRRYARELGLA